MTGQVNQTRHPPAPGPWRWQCGDASARWHYRIDDQGWAQTREEAERLLTEHRRREHTPEREARWEVSGGWGEWWAYNSVDRDGPGAFSTWREAFDYADRMARRQA